MSSPYPFSRPKLDCRRIGLAAIMSASALMWAQPAYASANVAQPQTSHVTLLNLEAVEMDILGLPASFTEQLDREIATIQDQTQRATALHRLLFDADTLNIRYHSKPTRTATEVLATGNGNCVSLANLYIAAARHVGLSAHFQESVVEEWQDIEDNSNYFIRAGHINVLVELPARRTMTVEFLQTYRGRDSDTRVMSDAEAQAHYYNNLGIDALHRSDFQLALTYIEKSLSMHDDSALVWSNLGVIEKRLGNLQAAERAYLMALKKEDTNASASRNLYVLYSQLEQPQKAQKYAAIVEKQNRRNPYYLDMLANQALDKQDYKTAINLAKQAIRIKDTEDRFYYSLAKAYHLSGDMKRAVRAMKKAETVASDPAERRKYQRKLSAFAPA